MNRFLIIILLVFSNPIYSQQLISPNYQFNSDPTIREINGRLYLFTTHDQSTVNFQGPEDFWHNMYDYHAYSTIDFKTWIDHGSALSIHDVKWASDFSVWDGDIGIPANGKYYAYVPFRSKEFEIGVLVSDRPEGSYIDVLGKPLINSDTLLKHGIVLQKEGMNHKVECLSPTVIYDENNQPYLIFGQWRVLAVKLKPNMIDFDGKIFEVEVPLFGGLASEYIEGPWIHKMQTKYYFTYMTYKDYEGKKNINFKESDPYGPYIQYCVSENMFGPYKNPKHWIYPLDSASCNVQHGVGVYKGKWYVAYHLPYQGKQHRQVAITHLKMNKNGNLQPIYPKEDNGIIPQDSTNLLLDAYAYKREAEEFHSRKDAYEERGTKQDFHFKIKDNGYLLFKNMDFGEGAKSLVISVSCENSKIKNARVEFRLDSLEGKIIGTADIGFTYWITYYKDYTGVINDATGVHDLYIVAKGENGDAYGRLFNINWFTFRK